MTTRTLLRQVCGSLLLVALWVAAPAFGATSDPTVLGEAGALYSLRATTIGANPALTLEVVRPGQPVTLATVPGTENESSEDSPSLIYQEQSDSIFLLWQSHDSGLHRALHLAVYRSGAWSSVTQLVGGPWSIKSAPQMLATHETFRERGANVDRQLTVLHVLWAEEIGSFFETLYAPIVMVDGEYVGHHDLYRLSDFDAAEPANLAFDVSAAVQQAPRLRPGRDNRSVAVAFANAATKRLVAMEIDVVPRALTRLGEEARGHIIITGVRNGYPAKRAASASEVAAWIRANGDGLLPEVVDDLANAVQARILADQGTDDEALTRLAEEARGHIIITGSRVRARGLAEAASADAAVTFASTAGDGQLAADDPGYWLRFGVTASRGAFRVGTGEARMFVAPDANRLAVAWYDATSLHYRVSEERGFSDTQTLALGPQLALERALEVLERRVANN
jgi:hypothetical protein